MFELAEYADFRNLQVVHGTADRMITLPHGELLCEGLGGEEKGVTKVIIPNRGHGLPMEWRRELTKLISGFIEKTEKL